MGKLGILCLLLFSLSTHAEPDIQISHALDNMFLDLSQLQSLQLTDYQNLIATHISPHIDTLSMAQLILGRHWKRASIKQKQRFLGCFSRQFRATQAQALLEWQPTSWVLQEQTFNENQTKAALVMALKHSQEARQFTLRLHRVDGHWLIYDASYLSISLLKNFKDDYALKINNQGLNKTLAQVCQQYPEVIKHLTLAGTQWPPFISRSLPGQGLSVEIVSAVLIRAGYEVDMVFAPWKRVMKGIEQGKYDVSLAIWKSPQREKHMRFSDPYFVNQLVGIHHKDSQLGMADLDDALSHSASLGLIDDYAYSPQIQQYPNRRYLNQYSALFRALSSKDLDFSLLDRSVARFYLDRSPSLKKSLQVNTITLETKPLHISMMLEHPSADKVIDDFNQYLKMYLKSQDYRALLDKYQLK
jgi:polar amino acid transport system substrate-binding protein